jgi:phage FluMu gp28-like protein
MNDFHRLFSRGQDTERPDWASWQMPTASNPYISPDEIEAARLDMTESNFMQEFEAAFISWEGQIFRRIREAATAPSGAQREDGHFYAIGCDWGRSRDFTCFVVIDCNTRTMVEIDRSNQVDYVVQRGRLRALAERWSPCVTVVEQNSIGQPIIEQLWRDGLRVHPFMTTNVSKANIIEALALALERGELRILNDPVLLSELQAFRAEPLPSGMLRYSAPAGMHDDTVMAAALALAAMAGVEAQRQQLPRRLYWHPTRPGLTSERPDFDAMQISPY